MKSAHVLHVKPHNVIFCVNLILSDGNILGADLFYCEKFTD